jgi:prevent-host-death family protein
MRMPGRPERRDPIQTIETHLAVPIGAAAARRLLPPAGTCVDETSAIRTAGSFPTRPRVVSMLPALFDLPPRLAYSVAMREVCSSELQSQLVDLLDDVEAGETVVITRDGKPVARLVPATSSAEAVRPFGKDAIEELKAWRKTLPPTGMTIDDILSARQEGRR